MSADRKHSDERDQPRGRSPTGPTNVAASLAPEDAGKHPIKITRAGEPGSHSDTRSTAAATRTT